LIRKIILGAVCQKRQRQQEVEGRGSEEGGAHGREVEEGGLAKKNKTPDSLNAIVSGPAP
jgi:hypothetical protein